VKTSEDEIHIRGAPVSDGIAIGYPIFLAEEAENPIPNFPITTGEVESEIARYRQALSSSRSDLRKLQEDLAGEGSSDAVLILDTHIQMLEDPIMTTHVEDKIRELLKNTESVFHSIIADYEKRFAQTTDGFFQQRLSDVKDLTHRVLRNLCPIQKNLLEEIPPNSIVFAKELIPSDAASIQAFRVSAFVTQNGGTCHAALIARAKGIPYVASIDVNKLYEARGKCVIVNGLTGDIIVNPSSDTLEKYEDLRSRLTQQYLHLEKDRDLPSETQDGSPILLHANVSGLEDVDLMLQHGAFGIGLFRSEFLFMNDRELLLDEERQYQQYMLLLQKAANLSCVFRCMDIGGDKYPELFEDIPKEANPVLGCRGIRFLLRRQDIFRVQLRAILRAALHGDVRLLIPLVSDITELRETRRIIQSVKLELESEAIPYKRDVSLGCMIEVPSAVLICDLLAQEVDFFAIGTNDLVQYTLGIDRSSDLYSPVHPSVIRMIQMVVASGRQYGKPVTICGEIASNPLFTQLLMGLGVRAFSCSPRFIPIIKRTIRQSTLSHSIEVADHVLSLRTASEVTGYLLSQVS